MSEEKNIIKAPMSAFGVLKKSNEGVKLPLFLPDGTETQEFLKIKGADSKEFKTAKSQANREYLDIADLLKDKKITQEEAEERDEKVHTKLLATLVCGWSFEPECTHSNVVDFFENSPQIKKEVNLAAADRANFFEKPPQD